MSDLRCRERKMGGCFVSDTITAQARAVAANAASWPVSDLVRLLLAVAKAKKAGNAGILSMINHFHQCQCSIIHPARL